MNTTMIPTLPTNNVAQIALWHANQALRAGRANKEHEFAVSANKMYDILDAASAPRDACAEMVRLLGRSKALVLKIERPIINLALR